MPQNLDHLNFFSPYERQPAGHENQLTRALLLLLRMSPLAHIEWLRLAVPDTTLSGLPSADFRTQKRAIELASTNDEGPRLVSVLLAPERPQQSSGEVEESDRGQVLDAVINYGGELVIVIENKIFEADDLQSKQINLGESGIKIADGQKVVFVLWRDLLESLLNLRERDLPGGTETALLDDFLTYVEDHFSGLGPFRMLALCQGIPGRV